MDHEDLIFSYIINDPGFQKQLENTALESNQGKDMALSWVAIAADGVAAFCKSYSSDCNGTLSIPDMTTLQIAQELCEFFCRKVTVQ